MAIILSELEPNSKLIKYPYLELKETSNGLLPPTVVLSPSPISVTYFLVSKSSKILEIVTLLIERSLEIWLREIGP